MIKIKTLSLHRFDKTINVTGHKITFDNEGKSEISVEIWEEVKDLGINIVEDKENEKGLVEQTKVKVKEIAPKETVSLPPTVPVETTPAPPAENITLDNSPKTIEDADISGEGKDVAKTIETTTEAGDAESKADKDGEGTNETEIENIEVDENAEIVAILEEKTVPVLKEMLKTSHADKTAEWSRLNKSALINYIIENPA